MTALRKRGSLAIAIAVLCGASARPDDAKAPSPPPVDPAAGALAAGRDALAARKWSECLAAFERAAAASMTPAEALAGASRCALGSDQAARGLDLARRASAADPALPAARGALGEALIRAGELEEALALFAELAAAAPDDARAQLGLGRLRVAEGEAEAGIAALDRAHTLAPDDPDVLIRYAGAVTNRADAVRVLERWLALAGSDDPERRESIMSTLAAWKALGDRSVWTIEGPQQRTELPLRTISDSPGSPPAGVIVELEAPAAGGKEGKRLRLRCLLDTGASGLYLSRRIAERLLRAEVSHGAVYGGGGSGRHETTRVILPAVQAGSLKFSDALAHIADGEVDRGDRYDAILGVDVFERFRTTLDLPGRKIVIEVPAPAGPGDPPPAGAIQVWSIEGQPLVRVGFNGEASGLMMLDTGADRTVLALAAAERIQGIRRSRRSAPAWGYGGAIGQVEDVSGLALRIPPIDEDRVSAVGIDLSRRSRLSGVEISGYLGLDHLRRCIIVLEPGQYRMSLALPSAKRGS